MKFLKINKLNFKLVNSKRLDLKNYEDFISKKKLENLEKKLNNKYHFIRNRKKFKKTYNKKNLINNNLELLLNIFLKNGLKKCLISKVNFAINDIYDIFYNPDEYKDDLIENFYERQNYIVLKKMFELNSEWFKFSELFPIFFENYKIIFDLKKPKNLKKKNKNIKIKLEFLYIKKPNRFKHLLPMIKYLMSKESSNLFKERFYLFFSNIASKGYNNDFEEKKIYIYSELLKSKSKK